MAKGRLGSYPFAAAYEPPNEYSLARSVFGRPRLQAGKVYRMRWLVAFSFGNEADYISAGYPLDPWSTAVKAEAMRDNPYLTWQAFVDSFGELHRQLEAFPHIFLNGREKKPIWRRRASGRCAR